MFATVMKIWKLNTVYSEAYLVPNKGSNSLPHTVYNLSSVFIKDDFSHKGVRKSIHTKPNFS